MRVGMRGEALRDLAPGVHSCVSLCGDVLVLRLATRKNRQNMASKLARSCSCSGYRELCPVRVLGPWLHNCPRAQPSRAWTPKKFLAKLRETLHICQVPNASQFNSKCFRRGHRQDLAMFGGSYAAVRGSGQWASRGGMQCYLDDEELENAAANTAARASRSVCARSIQDSLFTRLHLQAEERSAPRDRQEMAEAISHQCDSYRAVLHASLCRWGS